MQKLLIRFFVTSLVAAALAMVYFWLSRPTVKGYEAKIEPYTHYIYSNIEVRPKHIYEIGVSQYADRIIEMPWKVGDRIKKGDVVLRLDIQDEEISMRRIVANDNNLNELAKLKLNTEWSILTEQENLNHLQSEFNKDYVVDHEVEKILDRLEQLDNALKKEKYYSDYRLEKSELARRGVESIFANNVLKSPISGIISAIYKEKGEFLPLGETAMELFDDSELEVVGEVFEEDQGFLTSDKLARVEFNAYPDQEFKGFVDMVYPKNDQEFQKIEVRLKVEDLPKNLAPGLKGLAAFHVAFTDFEVVVPSTAVFRSQVQLIEKGKIKYHPVEIGFKGLFQNVIRHGLPEGAIVMKEFDSTLEDGMRVKVELSQNPNQVESHGS